MPRLSDAPQPHLPGYPAPRGPRPLRSAEIRDRDTQVCAAHRGGEAGASCVTAYEWEKPVRHVGPCVHGHREGPPR